MSYSSPPQSPGAASTSGRPQSPREQRNRTFSFRSDRSSESKSSRPKIDLKETTKDKRRLSATTKTNPNAALSEIQPAEMAAQASTSSNGLRGQQFKDSYGNAITDPDTSNPTRSRMERPLDTIRAFEDQIEQGFRRRTGGGGGGGGGPSNHQPDSVLGNAGPRSSYIGNTGNSPWKSGPHQRSQSYRHDYHQGGPPQRPAHYRGQSAPLSRPMPEHEVYQSYPPHEHQESYEQHMYAGGSSGSASDPWGNSTDPSSENSSVDRIQGMNNRMDYNDAYGYPSNKPRGSPMRDGYGNPYPPPQAQYDPSYFPPRQQSPRGPPYGHPTPPNDGIQAMTPPPPPRHEPQQQQQQQQPPQRNVIPLGGPALPAGPPPATQMQGPPQQYYQQQQNPPPMNTPPAMGSQQPFNPSQQQRPMQGQRLAKKQPPAPPVSPPAEEKKKGWLKRRFSKN